MSQDLVASRPHFQKWARAAFYSHFLHPMTTSLCGKIFSPTKNKEIIYLRLPWLVEILS